MPTKTLMTVEEYLRTSFEDGDLEYVDGELVERNMGEFKHGRTQLHLGRVLLDRLERLGFQVGTDIRIRISSSRYRIPDIAVWRPGDVGGSVPTVPPFLAIEILSPDDRMTRVKVKIDEYLSIGIEWIWIIDPYERVALCYSQGNPVGSLCEVLRTENPTIEIPLAEVLAPLS